MKNIAIVGGRGALGRALVKELSMHHPDTTIHAISHSHHDEPLPNYPNVTYQTLFGNDEHMLEAIAKKITEHAALDLVIVATGLLHTNEIMPEKSLSQLSEMKFQQLFSANTIFPALVAKHFLPKLHKRKSAIFAALSARVGSISDNRSGGWYAYRASKAALNMIIKNSAIEIQRTHKQAIVIGLHPGTVDSKLSKPFQKNVPSTQLFSPNYSAQKMLSVLEKLTITDSGKCFAWDGKEVNP